MTVFIVLYSNYGDQGVDFEGVFDSQEKAELFVVGKPLQDRQWYDIVETEVQ